jgi:hypothetical protein
MLDRRLPLAGTNYEPNYLFCFESHLRDIRICRVRINRLGAAKSSPDHSCELRQIRPKRWRANAPAPFYCGWIFRHNVSTHLEGIISAEEYRKYVTFQQHINEDPALKELDAKISDHLKELRRLRAEATAVRERLISANPEVMAIRDKISGAVMHLLPGTGSTLMPMPVKSN